MSELKFHPLSCGRGPWKKTLSSLCNPKTQRRVKPGVVPNALCSSHSMVRLFLYETPGGICRRELMLRGTRSLVPRHAGDKGVLLLAMVTVNPTRCIYDSALGYHVLIDRIQFPALFRVFLEEIVLSSVDYFLICICNLGSSMPDMCGSQGSREC